MNHYPHFLRLFPGLFLFLLMIFISAIAWSDGNFLPPEQAFPLSAEALDASTVRLIWATKNGYHLYREKLHFVSETPGVTLGAPIIPAGVAKSDEDFGAIHILHGILEVILPIHNTVAASQLRLNVTNQGCADAGLCYPPQRRILEIALPISRSEGVDVSSPVIIPSVAPVSESDRLAALLAGRNWLLIGAAFFGVGLLLAFTPCVFPMIPILSGIIAGQGANLTTRKAFILTLIYVLAMAFTYTVAGILAGLFGANLQAAFQNPGILAAFILVFVLLALSMFGFYELQIPSSWQSRLAAFSNHQQGGTWMGVALMGLFSALIVGPCVAPPLVAALLYISKSGDAVLGGWALFALALGMGAPLLVIGTSAGRLLPRAGNWMNAVKAVFGVGLLAVAVVLLERIVPPALALVAWGILMITSAVYLGATRASAPGASGWAQLGQGLGLVLLIYGALMLIGAAAGGTDTLQPLRGLRLGGGSGAASAQVAFRRIKTLADLEGALDVAKRQGRAVLLDFYANWCVSCKEMERYIFSDPAVIAALAEVILLQADVTANDEQDQILMRKNFNIFGPPAILFFGPDGKERVDYRVVGMMDAPTFAAHVRKALTSISSIKISASSGAN